MSDRKALARQLWAESAILAALKDAHAETRDRARSEFDSNDAESVRLGQTVVGRVRRNKESKTWRIADWPAFERWVREHVPHAWIAIPQVDPSFRAAVLKTGEWIDTDGVVHEVDGLAFTVIEGSVVATSTDAGTDWARQVVVAQLPEIGS
jgi:hypothetical protein